MGLDTILKTGPLLILAFNGLLDSASVGQYASLPITAATTALGAAYCAFILALSTPL